MSTRTDRATSPEQVIPPECCRAILGTVRHVQAAHFQDTGHRPGWWSVAAHWSALVRARQAEQASAREAAAREQDRRLQAYDSLIVHCRACGDPRLPDYPHACSTAAAAAA